MNSKSAWMLASPLLVSLISVGAAGASETQPSIVPLELRADYTGGSAGEAGVNVGRGQQVGTGIASRAASSWLVQGDVDDFDADDPMESDESTDNQPIEPSTRPQAVGLTAAMLVGALETQALEPPRLDPARDNEKGSLQSEGHPAAVEAPGGNFWNVAGTLFGAITVGMGAGFAAQGPSGDFNLGVGIAGAVVGGLGGYLLGSLARHGSSAAQAGVVILTVVGILAPMVVGTVALGNACYASVRNSSFSGL